MQKPLPIVKPDTKKKDSVEDMLTQLLKQVLKAINGRRYYEAYLLIWTSTEQFLLPDLLGFVAKKLKVDLPKNLSELPISHTIRLYYFISHDKELFKALERSRKTRNKLIHNLYKQKDWSEVKTSLKVAITEEQLLLLTLFEDRLTGKTPIPALQIYRKGWNDALDQLKKKMLEKLSD